MQGTWHSLLPPIIVLGFAYISHRVLLSLLLGIFSAALIYTDFSVPKTLSLVSYRLWENTELSSLRSWETFWANWNLFVIIFLCILGIMVTLIAHTGGVYAYRRFVQKKIKNKKQAETATLALASTLFVDDYFNSLTTGAVMHQITDTFKIPRAKLAFLVDSMAAPLSIMIPISSWVAAIMLQLRESGVAKTSVPNLLIQADPFIVYFRTIPYIFYSLLIVAASWFIVRRGISFGLMGEHEQIANDTGNLFGGKAPGRRRIREASQEQCTNCTMTNFLLPIGTLFVSVIAGVLYSGGYSLFGGPHTAIEAFQNAQAPLALFTGGMLALFISMGYFLLTKTIPLQEAADICTEGTRLMLPSIMILLLAWTLGNLLREDLLTGGYLASVLLGHVTIKLFPLMFYIASFLTSFAIGSSWGTMAIMFPIAMPMLISFLGLAAPAPLTELATLFPVLGAILSGGVLGDHISPISDTTVMSSASTGAHHIDHVRTQMGYAAPVAIATGIAFLVAGMTTPGTWLSYALSLGSGLVSCLGMLWWLDRKN